MRTLTSVPVAVTPEAANRIGELRMHTEFDRMIEHTLEIVPGLQRIDVILVPAYDTEDEPGITIEATREGPYNKDDRTDWDWGDWFVDSFPPDVCRHFVLLSIHGPTNAR